MSTGEELYILDKDKFLCKEDYFNIKNSQGKPITAIFLGACLVTAYL